MVAVFHWSGIVEDSSERLMRYVRGLEIKVAASLRNQKEAVRPCAVDLRLLRNLGTVYPELKLVC